MRSQTQRGFTLIELLVVIAIIAILASILFPIFAKAREKARQTTCTSNLRQLAMATTMYIQDNKNRFPGVVAMNADGTLGNYTGWATQVINYVKGGDNSTVSKNDLFYCPDLPLADVSEPIAYGYSSMLLKTDGTGVSEASVKQPTQVGVMCDADPGIPFMCTAAAASAVTGGGGGIVGGYSIIFQANTVSASSKLAVIPSPRHNKGTIMGFADGHAAICPDQFNVNDSSNNVTRAFYMASALGLVDNPSASLGGPTSANPNIPFGAAAAVTAGTNDFATLGGDPVCKPILEALAEAHKAVATGFTYSDDGYAGCLINDSDHPAEYVQGNATGAAHTVANGTAYNLTWAAPAGNNTTVGQQFEENIGQDAMVVIVNKACTIASTVSQYLASKTTPSSPTRPTMRSITLTELQNIFNSDGYSVTGIGATSHDFQVYIQQPLDGTRIYLKSAVPAAAAAGGYGILVPDGFLGQVNTTSTYAGYTTSNNGTAVVGADAYRGIYGTSDADIVDKVAGDPLGIAIVSASVADTKRVDIVAINGTGATVPWQTFPSSSARTGTSSSVASGLYPVSTSATTVDGASLPIGSSKCTWAFRRTLYAEEASNNTTSTTAPYSGPYGTIFPLTSATQGLAFFKGPLYKASFFTQ